MSVSRQGVPILRNVGLDELLAEPPEQYVRIASHLAGDVSCLTALRSALWERVRGSPLLDARRLTRDLTAAYRDMCQKSLIARDRINR